MEEKKPEKFSREWFVEQGKLGPKKQHRGKTKKEIREYMKKVREGQKVNK